MSDVDDAGTTGEDASWNEYLGEEGSAVTGADDLVEAEGTLETAQDWLDWAEQDEAWGDASAAEAERDVSQALVDLEQGWVETAAKEFGMADIQTESALESYDTALEEVGLAEDALADAGESLEAYDADAVAEEPYDADAGADV